MLAMLLGIVGTALLRVFDVSVEVEASGHFVLLAPCPLLFEGWCVCVQNTLAWCGLAEIGFRTIVRVR